VTDPVAAKLVKDWEPSRGNVTGVSDLLALDKQMDLVKQVVPNAKRVGVVYWPCSDVAIKGEYPDYWHSYAKKPLLTYVERVAKIEEMLKMPADKRPQLIMA
jgi:ABC-type uncharacterized transport system substrate-binding protein